ncbi:hypothetical protein Tco_0174978 [Tanacetum coccineum]
MANLDFYDKHNMVAYLQKSEGSEGFRQIIDFLTTSHIRYALTESPTIYVSFIEQFWQTAFASTLENGDMEITAIIDGKVKGQILQGKGSTIPVESHHTPISAPSTSQPPTSPSSMQTTHVAEEAATMPIFTFLWRLTHLEVMRAQSILASPLALRSLMGLISASSASVSFPNLLLSSCTVESVLMLFVSTKSTSNAFPGLMVVSKDEDALEDLSKQGRKIAHIDEDERITLVQMSAQTRGRHEYDFEESDFEFIALEEDYTAEPYYSEEWDNIQAQIEADEELAHRLQAQERERYSEADKARLLVELINERKNMGSHTLQQLKKLSFDEVKELFETTMKRVNTFTPMESDDTVPKVVAGSSKIDAEQELNQESSKRQKIGEGSEPAEESKDELSQEQLQQLMIIVPEEGMNVEALQTKYPIIDWEVYTEDSRKYWKIIKVGNHTEVYQIFEDMLKNFDRDDLVKLWSLVHERFNSTEPTKDKERELWVELKRLFEPDDDDTLWKLQRYMHDPLKWRLYDTCVVHHVSTERGHDIFMLVEKDYPLTRALMTLMLSNKLQVDEYSVMADELLRKIFILANRPRQ